MEEPHGVPCLARPMPATGGKRTSVVPGGELKPLAYPEGAAVGAWSRPTAVHQTRVMLTGC